jgi:hypothetical protein
MLVIATQFPTAAQTFVKNYPHFCHGWLLTTIRFVDGQPIGRFWSNFQVAAVKK